MSHDSLLGKRAAGAPHEDGSGLPFVISSGTEPRGKYHTVMPVESQLCANTPPACVLNPCPNESPPDWKNAQPALLSGVLVQGLLLKLPVAAPALVTVHVGPLCSVI